MIVESVNYSEKCNIAEHLVRVNKKNIDKSNSTVNLQYNNSIETKQKKRIYGLKLCEGFV
jgi:predicted fused transcriptional regulator/phosphomethylpyrimidine kinase